MTDEEKARLYDPQFTPQLYKPEVKSVGKCKVHDAADTGMKWSFCRKCDQNLMYDHKLGVYVPKENK